jgi:hypothetical protein
MLGLLEIPQSTCTRPPASKVVQFPVMTTLNHFDIIVCAILFPAQINFWPYSINLIYFLLLALLLTGIYQLLIGLQLCFDNTICNQAAITRNFY